MPQFSSDADRKKWESLQNSAGTSLTAIVQGRASSSDFQRVATVLNGLNGLAANVFSQAISAAEVQAKKFQAQYEGALNLRDNQTLSAFEIAMNDQFAKIVPDITATLKEIIELSNLESNEDLTRTIGGRFSDLADLLPSKDLPTTNDLLAANDLLAEQISSQDDLKWEAREDSLVNRITDAFRSTLRDLADSINRERAARSGGQSKPNDVKRLMAPAQHAHHADWEVMDVDEAPLITQAHALLGGPSEETAHEVMNAPGQPGGTVTASSTLPTGKEGPTISLSTRAENAITKAASDQTDLYKQLLDFLTNPADAAGAQGKQDTKDDEEEKADTWWRSFRNWTGDIGKKYKDFKKDNGGWLETLGSALALMILDPTLFKTLGDLIEKYVTWDNIKSAVSTAWDWVVSQGENVVDWVMSKLGLDKVDQKTATSDKEGGKDLATTPTKPGDKTHADFKNLTPEQQAQMAQFDAANKDKNPNAVAVGDPSTGGHSSWESKVAGWFGVKLGSSAIDKSAIANTDTNPNSPTYGQSTVVDPSSVSGSGRSSLTAGPGSPQSTMTVDGNPVKFNLGTTTAPPGSGTSGDIGPGFDSRNIKGSPQSGITSFGYNAGIDDSIHMMNTPYFTE